MGQCTRFRLPLLLCRISTHLHGALKHAADLDEFRDMDRATHHTVIEAAVRFRAAQQRRHAADLREANSSMLPPPSFGSPMLAYTASTYKHPGDTDSHLAGDLHQNSYSQVNGAYDPSSATASSLRRARFLLPRITISRLFRTWQVSEVAVVVVAAVAMLSRVVQSSATFSSLITCTTHHRRCRMFYCKR